MDSIMIELLAPVFSVCKVADYSGVDREERYVFTGSTEEEKSLVCPEALVPENTVSRDDGWRCFRICGVLDFSLIGILAKVSAVLAEQKIGIFAVSTYNTDYILTKEENFSRAVAALEAAGCSVRRTENKAWEVETLRYYAENADAFFEGTVSADMTPSQERFLNRLPAGARILDLGCGSGRDTKAFLELGYSVDAVDGSEELCRRASEFTGIQVRCLLFQDLDQLYAKDPEKDPGARGCYDGIWACASLLHLPRKELLEVFRKVRDALKPGGILYTGFKYGSFEGMRNGRYFTDFTAESFREFLAEVSGLSELEHWVTADVRPGRGEEQWLNVLLQRANSSR